MRCALCQRRTEKYFRHHIVPKVKGGTHKGTVECCRTCSRQVHMLFSENELSKMTLDELRDTEDMQKYISWIQKRRGEYKVRKSTRLKKRK